MSSHHRGFLNWFLALFGRRRRRKAAERPIKVFISSVMTPALFEARREIERSLSPYPWLETWTFETTPASSEPVEESYLRHVREADIVFWLAGDRTSAPVEREVREALRTSRLLLVFLLPTDERDERTEALIMQVGTRAKWMSVEPGRLYEAIRLTLQDEVIRALRRKPGRGHLDQVEEIARASRARCIDRWVAAGVPRSLASDLADDKSVGAPPSGLPFESGAGVLLLLGDIGAGKSLLAERLLQTAIRRFSENPGAPIPMFLTAYAAGESLHDTAYALAQGLGEPRVQGAFILVDGADEVGAVKADSLVSSANILADTWPQTTVVITSRNRPPSPRKEEVVVIPPLPEPDALALVSRVAGEEVTASRALGWPESVREAIRRPLYAILLGSYLRDRTPEVPWSIADLLKSLATRSLSRLSVDEASAQRAAEWLALLSTDRGGGPIPLAEAGAENEVGVLLGSGLVVEHAGAVGFPLPILRQWFAARSLRRGDPSAEELLATPPRLWRWHYPLVVAVGHFSHDEVTRILRPIVSALPSYASVLVAEGLGGWGLEEDVPPPPALESGERIREAMLAWIEGLGTLADLIAPMKKSGSLRTLGVRIDGALLTSAWYAGTRDLPAIVEVSVDDLHGTNAVHEWPAHRTARPGRWSGWAWRWTLSELSGVLRPFVTQMILPSMHEVLIREAAWSLALTLTMQGSFNHRPIPVDRIETALWRFPPEKDSYRSPQDRFRLRCLRSEVARVQARGETHLPAPWPGPDVDPHDESSWNSFSSERLRLRGESVYLGALRAYRALVEEFFAKFAPRLDTYALLPARIVGEVRRPGGDRESLLPVVAWYLEPLPQGQECKAEFRLVEARSPSRQELEALFSRLRAARPEVADWVTISYAHSALDVFGPNPATELAYDWLSQDLRRVQWRA